MSGLAQVNAGGMSGGSLHAPASLHAGGPLHADGSLHADAIVFDAPGAVRLAPLALIEPGPEDVVVESRWSGISTGTESLLLTGSMPPFPGLSYPLVPGYESVGTVLRAGSRSGRREGDLVFVPGARCHEGAADLFGATSSHLVVPGARTVPVREEWGEASVLLALAATAHHALAAPAATPPDLIVGHGVVGRLLARLTVALGHDAPTVWEREEIRRGGAEGYRVIDPDRDERMDYRSPFDASGDSTILDRLVARTAKGAEIVLAGFYARPLQFAFPPAFMRETRIRIAAEFTPADMQAVIALVSDGALSLDGLVTHSSPATEAASAYRTAFGQPACLKMILDWRDAR